MAIPKQQVNAAMDALVTANGDIARMLAGAPVSSLDLDRVEAFATFLEKLGRATSDFLDEIAELDTEGGLVGGDVGLLRPGGQP